MITDSGYAGATHYFLTTLRLLSVCTVPTASAEENAGNVGQDFTRPLGRVDVRWTYRDLPDGAESHTTTLRAEQPWDLSDQWKLNTRFEIPGIYKSLPDNNQDNFNNKKWFMPIDVTYGKRWGDLISSIEVSYPIVDDLDLYEVKTQLRVGYFF